MANLKNGAIREMVIDRCLSDPKRRYSTKDIMKACNKILAQEGYEEVTSLNTIRNDMRAIEQRWISYGGEIKEESQGRNKYYYYKNADFSIYKTGLTQDDLSKLNQTLMVLRRFQGLPQFEWIDELNARFKSAFMAPPNTKAVISFDENIDVEGRQYVSTLFDANINKQVLKVNYQSFTKSNPSVHTVHPYYLKEYNNRWFLLGLDEHYHVLTTFALDRILSISISHKTYIENKTIDFNEYFEEVIGVTIKSEEQLQKIKLWVSKEQYPYLKTKPLHGTQKVLEHREDDSKVIQIEVKENYELIQELLSFGEKVVVLEPQEIRKKIQERIWLTGENYDKIE